MRFSSVVVSFATLVSQYTLVTGESLRGNQLPSKKTPYRGKIHVVPAKAHGEENKDRRDLYEGRPDVLRQNVTTPITGTVFNDLNKNGQQDAGEPGIQGVMVSDGMNVVLTDAKGGYELPTPSEEDAMNGISIFVTKPAGYQVPVNEDMVPQFYYHHKPAGSPLSVHGRPFRYGGLPPTGPLPEAINFPLAETEDVQTFKIIVAGDSQTYSSNEVGYLRDSLVKDVAGMDGLQALFVDGDIMGDELSHYPRYKNVMSLTNIPTYYGAGNHDVDYDSPSYPHSHDTFKREMGPNYYSYDIGQVHFVVMDDIYYPCTPDMNMDGLHSFCDDPAGHPSYNGFIPERQMNWLRNDLANVPADKLIFVSMHIPIIDFIDQEAPKHMLDNVIELYEALGCVSTSANATVTVSRASMNGNVFLPENCARPVVAIGGHTHTNDNMLAGENFDGFNTALGARSGGPLPFHQIVVGASCGGWWGGNLDTSVIPESYQRLGALKGYFIFEFDGNSYMETFRPSGMPAEKQMHVDFATPEFVEWYNALKNYTESNPGPEEAPPYSINDLPDTKMLLLGSNTTLSANVYAGTRKHIVQAVFDNGAMNLMMERTQPGDGEKIKETLDPYALKRQLAIARFAYTSTADQPQSNTNLKGDVRAVGYEQFNGEKHQGTPRPEGTFSWADQSLHVWQVAVPIEDLGVGAHSVTVMATDQYGRVWNETVPFEIASARPFPYFQDVFFPVHP